MRIYLKPSIELGKIKCINNNTHADNKSRFIIGWTFDLTQNFKIDDLENHLTHLRFPIAAIFYPGLALKQRAQF